MAYELGLLYLHRHGCVLSRSSFGGGVSGSSELQLWSEVPFPLAAGSHSAVEIDSLARGSLMSN